MLLIEIPTRVHDLKNVQLLHFLSVLVPGDFKALQLEEAHFIAILYCRTVYVDR